jgi:Helix-turn-helix domain
MEQRSVRPHLYNSSPVTTEPSLTTDQTARLLRVTRHRVRQLAVEGRIPFAWGTVRGRPARLFKVSDVLGFDNVKRKPGRPRKEEGGETAT